MTNELLHSAAATLNRMLDGAAPADIIAEALRSAPDGRLAAVSSFGTESAVLLKFVADVDPAIPVLFLDTGWLFEETIDYRDTLVRRLGLTDIRTLTPDNGTLESCRSGTRFVVPRSGCLLQHQKSRAVGKGLAWLRRLAQRPQAFPRERTAGGLPLSRPTESG